MNLKKLNLNKYLYLDLIIFILCMLLPGIFLIKLAGFNIAKMPLFRDFCIICIFACLLYFIKNNRIRYILECLLVFLISIYSYSQLLHFRFFDSFYSFKKASVINELFSVFSEITRKLSFSDFLFLIPLVLMICYVLLDPFKKEKRTFDLKISLIIIVLTLLLNVFGYKYFINVLAQNRSDWNEDYYHYFNMYNKNRFLSRFGVYEYIYKDISLSLKDNENKELSAEEKTNIKEFISKHNHQDKNEMTSLFEGKNLIMVLGESFDSSAISKELTPTLYKMKEEGYYFSNYYAPIYLSATGDSEYISQTSMLPSIDYGTTSYTFYNNSFPYSLANLFKENNYSANSYHAYLAQFYNREAFHEALGFTTFYDMEKLGINFWYEFETGTNWLDAKDMFLAMMKQTNTAKPFYNLAISVSGHLPYIDYRKELKDNLKLIDNSTYASYPIEAKCYLAAQMNFDQGLEALLSSLKQEGVLDNTVILIYGDHYPYGISDIEAINKIVEYDDYRKYNVPLIIYDCSEEYGKQEIDTLCSTFDIYPTITNLFNLDYKDNFTLGNDIFSNEDRKVLFMDRSILTENFYYDCSNGSVIPLNENYNEEELKKYLNEIEDIFKYGQEILTSNYYNNK